MRRVTIKRIYEPPLESDGARVLVDRLWPRGITKASAHVRLWIRDAAPSRELRQWFAHEPERWDEFKKRYFAELEENREALEPLLDLVRNGSVTLIYASREQRYNNAVALAEFLDSRI